MTEYEYLTHIGGPKLIGSGPLLLVIVHNEARILRDFLRHYRGFGALQIAAIDDRSTDATPDILAEDPQIARFVPHEGSTFRTHKDHWRREVLDTFGKGRWCLLPDADEHLVWHGFEDRPFAQFLADLDAEGAEALVADMIDMYADKPLADHVAEPGPLIDQFPCFDDPRLDPDNYRVSLVPSGRFRRAFPCPNTEAYGGMRDRIFGGGPARHGWLGRRLLTKGLDGPRQWPERPLSLAGVAARLARNRASRPHVLNKLPLVKWRAGLAFGGAQHHLNTRLPLSHEKAVLLHFCLTGGAEAVRHIVDRAQHAEGSVYYRQMLDKLGRDGASPVYSGTGHYRSSADLGALLVGPRGG